MKMLSVVGTIPQYIKAAMIDQALKKHDVTHVVVHTGQHYDAMMSEDFYKDLGMPEPIMNLNCGGKDFNTMLDSMNVELKILFEAVKPDIVIVYGDCTSTLAGAQSAIGKGIKLAHIEAGLRCYNITMIEEQIRARVDILADLLFCPTKTAVKNLQKQGVDGMVFNYGDVMLDAFIQFGTIDIPEEKSDYIYCTLHRNEGKFEEAIEALGTLDKKIILPLHPRHKNCSIEFPKNIKVISPISYNESLYLVNNALAVITDSGGVQREAYYANTPCLVVRNETEWKECNQPLLPVNELNLMRPMLDKLLNEWKPAKDFNDIWKPFGSGEAASNIAKQLLK